ncbi:MAG TPA: 2TM domain-containing protein, partial [Candidatus Dormibacteraeota bacterium]
MTTETSDMMAAPQTAEERRALAIKRIKAKNEFTIHLVVYLCVNGMLTLIWAFTSLGKPFLAGFFWPIIPLAGWGIG